MTLAGACHGKGAARGDLLSVRRQVSVLFLIECLPRGNPRPVLLASLEP